jgi:hypothetical protein
MPLRLEEFGEIMESIEIMGAIGNNKGLHTAGGYTLFLIPYWVSVDRASTKGHF